METRAHHVVIGLFVVLIVAAGLLFGLWLAKNHTDSREVYQYDVVFNEAVNGLSEGSAVMYSGIRVGDVTRLRLDPVDPRKVVARIRIIGAVPMKEDTRAQLRLTGVTGTSVIQLSGGTPESPRLASADDAVPVIEATPSPLTQLLAGGEDLMLSVNELVANSRKLLSDENAQQLARILQNLEHTTGAIAAQRDDFAELVASLSQVSRNAGETLQRTSSLALHADQLVGEHGRPAMESAQQAMRSAQQAMQALAQASTSIDTLVQENRGAIDGGAQSMNELGAALRELRATLASLRVITRRLEDNPAEYLLGREQAKEFTP